jgi:hypothetical protein
MPDYVKKSISMQAIEDKKLIKQAAAAALDCIQDFTPHWGEFCQALR